jgi:hypothetical protein
MSKIRAIITTLRVDKLVAMDVLDLVKFYLTIAFHLVMLAFIVFVFKWFLFIVN